MFEIELRSTADGFTLRPASLHKFEKRGIALPLTMFSGLPPSQGNGAAERPPM